MHVPEPQSGSFQEDKARTTCLAGVISLTCTAPARSCVYAYRQKG